MQFTRRFRSLSPAFPARSSPNSVRIPKHVAVKKSKSINETVEEFVSETIHNLGVVQDGDADRFVEELVGDENLRMAAARRARLRRAEASVIHAESIYDTLAESDEEEDEGRAFFSEKGVSTSEGGGF